MDLSKKVNGWNRLPRYLRSHCSNSRGHSQAEWRENDRLKGARGRSYTVRPLGDKYSLEDRAALESLKDQTPKPMGRKSRLQAGQVILIPGLVLR